MLEEWVQNPMIAKNLVIFPQAVTVARHNFVKFALPTFEFVAAHPNQVEIVPVCISYDMPYPIHLRKADSSFLFDFLLLMMMPYAKVTYALLEPVPLHGRSAEEIKEECENKIVECSLRQCERHNIDYRDKVAWRHMLHARLHPTYRSFEVAIINRIQSVPGFKVPSLPRRSQTCLDDVIDSHRRRVMMTLGPIEDTLASIKTEPSSIRPSFRDESLPVPQRFLDGSFDDMSRVSLVT